MCALCTIYGKTLCISKHDVLSSLLLERTYTSTCTNTHNIELAFMHCIDAPMQNSDRIDRNKKKLKEIKSRVILTIR